MDLMLLESTSMADVYASVSSRWMEMVDGRCLGDLRRQCNEVVDSCGGSAGDWCGWWMEGKEDGLK